MSRNIYKGYNFIFEQMSADTSKKDDLSSIIYGIVPPVLSSMTAAGAPETKTSSSFKSFSDAMLSLKDFNGLKEMVMEQVEKIKSEGKEEFKKGISELFDQLMKVPDVNKKFESAKTIIKSILDETAGIIEEVEKMSEKPVNEKYGSLETTDFPKARRAGKSYVDSADRLMRAATALFMDTRPGHLDPKIEKEPEIQKFVKRAEEIYKTDAPDLQIEGKRKGLFGLGKIRTEGGDEKATNFYIKVDKLMDEIGTIRKEIAKMRGKTTNVVVTPPTPPSPVPTKTETTTTTTDTTKTETTKTGGGDSGFSDCGFPIGVSSRRCNQVKEIQEKLIKVPCIEEVLSKHGGADGKFGKYTSAAVHAAYNTITGKDDKSAVLTEEMYKAIMGADFGGSVKESINNSIFEMEYNKGGLLGFDDFNCVTKVYEQQSDLASKICNKFKAILPTIPGKKEIGGDKVQDKKDDKGEGVRKNWKGLKPAAGQELAISYDESLASAWTKVGIGVAGVSLAVFASPIAAGLATAAEGVGLGMAGTATPLAAAGTGLAGALTTGTASKVIMIGGGTIAANAGLSEWLSGRSNIKIGIASNGYIRKNSVLAMAAGCVDSLSGYVSKEDITSVMATLCALKGAWTSKNKKAISAWSLFKRSFEDDFGKPFTSDGALDFGTVLIRACEHFPDFESDDLSDGETVKSETARQQILDAIKELNNNEPLLAENIKGFTEEDINQSAKSTTKAVVLKESGEKEDKKSEE